MLKLKIHLTKMNYWIG